MTEESLRMMNEGGIREVEAESGEPWKAFTLARVVQNKTPTYKSLVTMSTQNWGVFLIYSWILWSYILHMEVPIHFMFLYSITAAILCLMHCLTYTCLHRQFINLLFVLLLQLFSHPLISLILHQVHNIISLQLLTVPPPFSSCTVTITSNNLKPGKLHTVSFDPVKNPGERLTVICWAFSLSSGAWMALVWQSMVALIYSGLLWEYISSWKWSGN